jgi:hypothetical protein
MVDTPFWTCFTVRLAGSSSPGGEQMAGNIKPEVDQTCGAMRGDGDRSPGAERRGVIPPSGGDAARGRAPLIAAAPACG